MKGIILAGGSGSRLYPSTKVVCKQLLPIYDKPMLYYPLSVLMLAGIRDILIISTQIDTPRIQNLLDDGSQLGLSISYAIQKEPRGLADAFIVGKNFIGVDTVCLILGDNIFYGSYFQTLLNESVTITDGAIIFGYSVKDPKRFGIVEIDNMKNVVSLEEKPNNPKSNWAIVGLYFYDNNVVEIAANLKPSPRGELEITDINKEYLYRGKLSVKLLGRGFAWLDTGTPGAMLEASNYVKIIEERQGFKISCIEEIAYRKGYIDRNQLLYLSEQLEKSEYGSYLIELAKEIKN